MEIPCDAIDRDLFNASTIIKVGKGNKTSFWHSNWINGCAPKNIAPSLFIKATRKKITVQKATENNKWISHITPILTLQELNEFILPWGELR